MLRNQPSHLPGAYGVTLFNSHFGYVLDRNAQHPSHPAILAHIAKQPHFSPVVSPQRCNETYKKASPTGNMNPGLIRTLKNTRAGLQGLRSA